MSQAKVSNVDKFKALCLEANIEVAESRINPLCAIIASLERPGFRA